jgi:L-iditol 2-dehydrogenase
MEPLACVTKAVFGIGDIESGEHVVILGPGPIGLLTTQVAKAVGAHVTLIGLRSDTTRLDLGRSLGAKQVLYAEDLDLIEQLTKAWGENGVDVVIECSGAEPALGLALEIVRNQGRVIQIGLFGKTIKADLDLIVFKDLALRGSFASSPTSWKQALNLTSKGQVDTRRLVSDVFSLDNWQTAFTRAAEGTGLKVVVQP